MEALLIIPIEAFPGTKRCRELFLGEIQLHLSITFISFLKEE